MTGANGNGAPPEGGGVTVDDLLRTIGDLYVRLDLANRDRAALAQVLAAERREPLTRDA